jgi:ABC-type molybdate transport system substrate-binding protein
MAAPAGAQTTCPPDKQLVIYHAGSLNAAFTAVERLFTAQTGICVTDVAAGSVDAARRITAGGEPCDIYASADYKNIEQLLEPAKFADYTIRFAEGAIVLAYTANSKKAATIAGPGAFDPPTSVPQAASDWTTQLTQTGVTIGGNHPFLDPGGYRVDLIFQLAEKTYKIANLYDTLLQHFSINKSSDTLGNTFDYQFLYESNALATYKADTTKTYRYVRLPDEIGLGKAGLNGLYRDVKITIPGLRVDRDDSTVTIPGSRVEWGLTILRSAPHPGNAIKFLQLLFGSQGVAAQRAAGPAPISPPLVSAEDFLRLPRGLKSLVKVDWKHHGY